jgi:hypothetical protein
MKDKNELLNDAGLVRDIEAWCQVKYPADDTERNFRDALFRKTFAELPAMEIQHVRRINEALCDMEFPTPTALGLRRETLNQLARHHHLKKYRHIKVPIIPSPKRNPATSAASWRFLSSGSGREICQCD